MRTGRPATYGDDLLPALITRDHPPRHAQDAHHPHERSVQADQASNAVQADPRLTGRLETLATAKAPAPATPTVNRAWNA